MAGTVAAVGPDGTPIVLPKEKIAENQATGGHVMSAREADQAQRDIARSVAKEAPPSPADLPESWIAAQHAGIRGVGESFGVPIDAGITGVADLISDDAGQRTRSYLNELDEKNPNLTAWMGLAGNVHGAVGASELIGAPGRAGAGAVPRTAGAVADRMAYGGLENVIGSTTRDINEAGLGRKELNGDKLFANIPKHFIVGAALTGAFEGGAAAVEKVGEKVLPRAAAGADRQASAALGREVGEAGEAAVAAGERIRGPGGERIPRNSSELIDILSAEQGASRRAQRKEYEGVVDALDGKHASEAANMSLRHEGMRGDVLRRGGAAVDEARAVGARGVQDAEHQRASGLLDSMLGAVENEQGAKAAAARARGLADEGLAGSMAEAGHSVDQVISHYEGLRATLAADRAATEKAAMSIGAERAANQRELEAAVAKLDGEGHGTPDLDEILGIMGHKGDPVTRWAIEERLHDLTGHLGESLSTANASTKLHVERLQSMAKDLELAHSNAVEHLGKLDAAGRTLEREAAQQIKVAGRVADANVAAFQKTAAVGVKDAEKGIGKAISEGEKGIGKAEKSGARAIEDASEAAQKGVNEARAGAEGEAKTFEKMSGKERAALEKAQAAERKGLKAPDGSTDVDGFLAAAQERAANRGPAVSGTAGLAAGLSLLHGNPVGAAGALLSSLAAGRVRAEGNFVAARAMREISQILRSTDDAIRRGAAQVVGRAGASGAMAASRGERAEREKPAKLPPFEKVIKNVRDAQANPSLIDRSVQAQVGHLSKDAPDTYTETLAAANRAQHYLESILPPPQRDPYSLTPHLEPADYPPGVRYDFMQAVATINDPIAVFRDVHEGTITEQQIAAVKAVYPPLFAQMQAEVDYQVRSLQKPLPYQQNVNVGMLLEVTTDEVLERDFQKVLSSSYKDKTEQGAPVGSKSSSAESQVTKQMMSTSERVERGE